MALCWQCGHVVSPRAKVCPSCGEPDPAPKEDHGSVLLDLSASSTKSDKLDLEGTIQCLLGLFFLGGSITLMYSYLAGVESFLVRTLLAITIGLFGAIFVWIYFLLNLIG